MSKNAEMNRLENNRVRLAGKVVELPVFNHEIFGEGFYIFKVEAGRTSGIADTIPVMVSDRMCYINEIAIGDLYEIEGQFRSYNKHEEVKNRLMLSVFAVDINEVDAEEFEEYNHIEIDGYLTKAPMYRETPLGRKITDLLIAVNRQYGKSDYIPAICWGRNAAFAGKLEVGNHVKLKGRIQRREYQKRISDTESETRVAYELSASRIELCM